jgi:hypothetical protein
MSEEEMSPVLGVLIDLQYFQLFEVIIFQVALQVGNSEPDFVAGGIK